MIKYSGSKIVSLAKKHAETIEAKGRAGCEKWSLKTPFKSAEFKNKMMACKAKAEIAGLTAGAAYAKKMIGHCEDGDCQKKIQAYFIDVKDGIEDNKRYL